MPDASCKIFVGLPTYNGWIRMESIHGLPMREIFALPETFTTDDLPGELLGRPLLVNTGLWICRFTDPWIEKMHFSIRDFIGQGPDGRWQAKAVSEDWDFSVRLADL